MAVVQGPRIFRRGERARLVADLGGAEVIVEGAHDIRCDTFFGSPGPISGTYLVRGVGASRPYVVDVAALRPADVEWKPGDVVVVRFDHINGADGYTYVRGSRDWPGDRASAKTDEVMNRWYSEGKVTPVLQAGGKPFDGRRLPR